MIPKKISRLLVILIFEFIIIYFIFYKWKSDIFEGTDALVAMAQILATLFALVFLLPHIIGNFVLKPHPRNLRDIYPKSLYLIASVFVLGIVFPVFKLISNSGTLSTPNSSLFARNISFFLFVNSIFLLVLYFSDIQENLSFNHRLKVLKRECISLTLLSDIKSYEELLHSIRRIYKHFVRKVYELRGRKLESSVEKIRTVIESLLEADKYHMFDSIEDIFEVIETLLDNNKPVFCKKLLDEMIKTSSVSSSYSMKKSTIDRLAKMNSIVIRNIRNVHNGTPNNEIMKRSIRGIAQIGSSSLEFNRDVLISEAQNSLKRIFDGCLKENLDEFDYKVFVYSLEKLAEKAFENNIKGAIRESITILDHITTSFRDRELRINPTKNVIERRRDIGIKCAEKKWENLLFNCFNTLLGLKDDVSEDYHLMLSSSALIIASYCNKYMPEVLPIIEDMLKGEIRDLEEVKKYSLTYTKSYSQIQYSVLKEYLNELQI